MPCKPTIAADLASSLRLVDMPGFLSLGNLGKAAEDVDCRMGDQAVINHSSLVVNRSVNRRSKANGGRHLRLSFAILIASSLSSGCSMYKAAARNIIDSPLTTSWECLSNVRNRIAANEVWDVVRSENPTISYTCDYEKGFKEGFIEAIQYAGPASPPPLPPKCYWGPKYQTVEGQSEIDNWFAGYRHGLQAAEESHYRSFVLIRTTGVGLPPPKNTNKLAEVDFPHEEGSAVPQAISGAQPLPVPQDAKPVEKENPQSTGVPQKPMPLAPKSDPKAKEKRPDA